MVAFLNCVQTRSASQINDQSERNRRTTKPREERSRQLGSGF